MEQEALPSKRNFIVMHRAALSVVVARKLICILPQCYSKTGVMAGRKSVEDGLQNIALYVVLYKRCCMYNGITTRLKGVAMAREGASIKGSWSFESSL